MVGRAVLGEPPAPPAETPLPERHRRSIRVSGFSLTFAVFFLVWFLGCLWLAGFIVRVEHVERVVVSGLLDDDHQAASEIESVAPLADGEVAVTVHCLESQVVDV